MPDYNKDMTEKNDYVIEAVHYLPRGQVDYVRLYERRGPSFSDRVIFNRSKLISVLQRKKKVVIGQRQSGLASTFVTTSEVFLGGTKDHPHPVYRKQH